MDIPRGISPSFRDDMSKEMGYRIKENQNLWDLKHRFLGIVECSIDTLSE